VLGGDRRPSTLPTAQVLDHAHTQYPGQTDRDTDPLADVVDHAVMAESEALQRAHARNPGRHADHHTTGEIGDQHPFRRRQPESHEYHRDGDRRGCRRQSQDDKMSGDDGSRDAPLGD
jgi:hypothetical protein